LTGFHAATPDEVRAHLTSLVADADLRRRVGEAAHDYIAEHRTIQTTSSDWAVALEAAAGGSVARAA
jgi:hypothetical protein